MVIFLSTGLLDKLAGRLVAGGYPEDTPAAIVYKASWDDQQVFRCTVGTLVRTAKDNKLQKTALVLIGDFLGAGYARSKLYDPAFAHEFREASE
jgi:precorrin-4/cobalt-precorrin-4 C11-methyltransferase